MGILKTGAVFLCTAAFLAGCSKQPAVQVNGQWELETISDTTGILAVGEAYPEEYFDGRKVALVCSLKQDTFVLSGGGQEYQGSYTVSGEYSGNTATLQLEFEDGTQTTATCGVRKGMDGVETQSMLFMVDDKIYSFLKAGS